jgi:hypothetical protein
MRRLWLSALALTILLPLLAVMLTITAVTASQAQCGPGLPGAAGPVGGVPAADDPIFQGAAGRFGLGDRGPSILAAINYVESTFGTSTAPGVHSGTNSAGAAGPMQIGTGGAAGDTWDTIKVNAPGDPPGQPPDVYVEADAVYSAAHDLTNSGAPADWPTAIFNYNHSTAYVQQVLSLAADYYAQGLTAQGSGGPGTTPVAGAVAAAHPFTVPPTNGDGDPAGPITLAQGQPTIVAATGFTNRTGAWGDNLTVATDSYAELSPGLPGSQVSKQDATMLGGLPTLTPLEVTNPHNGHSLILYKRDVGAGQPLSHTLDGYHYRIDLTPSAEQQLGLSGSGLVQVTRLDGPVNGPGDGQTCSTVSVGPGQYANPFAHTRALTPQRIDMGVDYDGQGEIDAIGDAHITFAATGIGGGWVCSTPTNGGVVYQLDNGPDQGKYVYVAEDVIPTVKAGDTVRAGQQIATFAPPDGTGCIEIGWAAGPGSPSPIALQDGGFQDGGGCAAWRTAAGDNMSDLIHSLGGPLGTCRNQPIEGHYP